MINKLEIVNEFKDLAIVKFNELLSNYCTFKTGGVAEVLIEPLSVDKIPSILEKISKKNIKITIIGGGSNLLVSDNGISGIVLRIANPENKKSSMKILKSGEIYVEATVSKEDFISFAVENGFSGIKFLVGVPGSIGGGIFMNAGTFMGTFSDILKSFDVALPDGTRKTVLSSELKSSYRSMGVLSGAVILSAIFQLPKSKNVQKLKLEVEDILKDRLSKHPVDFPSAGSVFKNPQGFSSWKLIDDIGFKGKKIGGAMVSEKHTNFIINSGNATSKDIKELIDLIQKKVSEEFNVKMETEIRMLGDFS